MATTDPTNSQIPAGFEQINGAQYDTTAKQQAAYDSIQVVGQLGQPGSYLIGKPKAPASAGGAPAPEATMPSAIPAGFEQIPGALFPTASAQQLAYSDIRPVGQVGAPGSYLIGRKRTQSLPLPGGSITVDPSGGVTQSSDPGAGAGTGEPTTLEDLTAAAGAGTSVDAITKMISDFEARNEALQREILSAQAPSGREAELQKKIDEMMSAAEQGKVNIEGRPIPLEDIAGQEQQLVNNANAVLAPLQRELQRLSDARSANLTRLTTALGFKNTSDSLALEKAKLIQTSLDEAAKTKRNFVLNLAGTYPDAGILGSDTPDEAAKKAANAPSFLAKNASQLQTSVVDVGGRKILIDSNTGNTIKDLGASDTSVQTQMIDTADGQLLIDKQGNVIKNFGTSAQRASAKSTQAQSLAEKFGSEAQVKDFNQVASGYVFSRNLPEKNPTGADNVGLIYAFAKAMDPSSVVREGEYNTIQKYAQSWLQTFGFNAQRILENKEFLTPQAIANMKKVIETKYLAYKGQYDVIFDQYAGQINRMTGNQDGRDWLIDYSLFTAANAAQNGTDPNADVRTQDQASTWNAILGGELETPAGAPTTSGGGTPSTGGSAQPGLIERLFNIKAGGGAPLSMTDAVKVTKVASAIRQFESGGNYLAVGPATKGGRALGAYQVMESNLAAWTKEALGWSLTREQFLNDRLAQDIVAIYKMGHLWRKYGNVEDIASVWFSGRPASGNKSKDVLGTSVPHYIAAVRSLYNGLS